MSEKISWKEKMVDDDLNKMYEIQECEKCPCYCMHTDGCKCNGICYIERFIDYLQELKKLREDNAELEKENDDLCEIIKEHEIEVNGEECND